MKPSPKYRHLNVKPFALEYSFGFVYFSGGKVLPFFNNRIIMDNIVLLILIVNNREENIRETL